MEESYRITPLSLTSGAGLGIFWALRSSHSKKRIMIVVPVKDAYPQKLVFILGPWEAGALSKP